MQNNNVKINGDIGWVSSIDYSSYAVALFRVRLIDFDATTSFLSNLGTVVVRIIKSAKDLYYRDIAIRFTTTDNSNETPMISVFDLNKDYSYGYSYRIKVMNDGYAYFYVKGSNVYDAFKYQLIYASNPAFIEPLGSNYTITASAYNDSTTNCLAYYSPTAGGYDSPTITYASNGSFSTNVNTLALRIANLRGNNFQLFGTSYVWSAVAAGTTIMTLSKGSIENAIFYVDVSVSENFSILTDLKRYPFKITTSGVISCLIDIPAGSQIFFDNTLAINV